MKKHILYIASLVFLNINVSFCQSEYLDKDFGNDGKVVANFQDQYNHCNAIAIQSDSKILIAGYTGHAGFSDFVIIRYNSDGSIDSAFGESGKVSTDFASVNERAQSVAVQQDGKIVVAGGTNDFFALARYNSHGIIDSLFGEHGKVTTNIRDYGHYMCGSMAVLQDGKLLLAGSIGYYGALVRYNSDGSPDDSFGEEGRVILDFGNMGDEYVFVSMALQQDNKIVVAGFSYVSDYDFTVLRYNENGTLDSQFGEDGKAIADIMDSSDDRATSVVIQPDGKIIVAGWSGVFGVESRGWDFGLARFNADGTLDDSFGKDGAVLSDLCNFWDDRPESVAIQSDGKILVAGTTYTVGYSDFALARYNNDGTLDTTFNSGGIIITDIGNSTYDNGIALAVQDDGKIIIAGISGDNIAVARYLPELNISNVDFSTTPDNLFIYPVPVSNEAILKYSLDRDVILSINLYDNTGNKIQNFINKEKRQRGHNSEILVFNSSLSPGYYILELSSTDKKVNVKIIKQ